jgi:hypothetical protein
MTHPSAIAVGTEKLSVRRMSRHELPIVSPGTHRRGLQRAMCMSAVPGRCDDEVGWVAELHGRIAGFIVCRVVLPAAASTLQRVARGLQRLLNIQTAPFCLELLDVLSQNEPCPAVEQCLLDYVLADLQRRWPEVPIVVQERNLTAQLLLREARYKAIRVLRGYFGEEDGYLMTQEPKDFFPRCDQTSDYALAQFPVFG